ncbi:Fe-S cluster assembly protein NifU [Vibrio natriegens]|uniref:Nitrogen fixation protein NifU n=1 Tax=Vibrio natriegens NBRC 15636 = ATCC 14048 = DSM 759 TaxID=1219067 RepID=A0AAN0Y7G7_VIBNA|nr:Fe-S cluster assembly protein NifU [Vibrio natriegens]ALR18083.1 nitrogen fixation protein NifU [Vibrio natriegens NBRC 15636 = ATCC 14048 = DSM 759]ANQ15583.1 Fe-S cluster assembly protein NifU [Vibrio natriegens NBRC 15636 = ATCC 14048 = DSM 759]EPM41556.1 nitrogen fixation protein NifU [Vibrio natriegens NBRC 15636 = ATCC 14048 = DSM 759]MDX6029048.1 Fe-S cluster assembly protein NifU [Vibrio natriegens NBRC 15636 = ATCC 14048 = DSM 759]UUI14242.1 Fe-S cluster assembly protein NifU [Vibr
MWDYSEKVKEHFFHPKNAKLVSDANARGDVGSISCGDALSLTLKVEPDTEVILDAGFQTFGCGSAIASSSALTEMIIGKSLDEAMSITNNDIAEYLDGLPPEKMHCSVMGMEALHAAVANYRGETLEDDHEEGELICKCFAIDDLMIKRVVAANKLTTLEEVINYTKAGGACTSCHEKIEWVLEDCLKEMAEQGLITDVSKKLDEPETEIVAIVESIIEQVRPSVQADGGDISLVDIEDNIIFVEMSGACVGCGLSGLTMANLEQKITQALGDAFTVFPVQQNASNTIKKEGSYDV